MSQRPRHIVWFRNDLRVDDHAPLREALAAGAPVPVYCFDPRSFGATSHGFPRTGPFRGAFLLESVQSLRDRLRDLGSDLIIRVGRPEEVLPSLAAQIGAVSVGAHREVGTEEAAIERAVACSLADRAVDVRWSWGSTLHDPNSLPFAIEALPDVFTHFRKQVEKKAEPESPLPAPRSIPDLALDVPHGDLPGARELGLEVRGAVESRGHAFRGGEEAAHERLQSWIWERDCLRRYKETRNGMLLADDSSKLSPWLALGCLSPRRVLAEVERYESERVRNNSTYWLVFELLWRDYFRYVGQRHGASLFRSSGVRGIEIPWRESSDAFGRWQAGLTGYPLVDAGMRELAATGFLSNRGRQNVASFLTKNLGLDWRLGAEWFESRLVDHDVCSNYGNWNYVAGVGNDARGFRYFDVLKQSRTYDPEATYLACWLPELAPVPAHKRHAPWTLTSAQWRQAGLERGRSYPDPMVDFDESVAMTRQAYERGG